MNRIILLDVDGVLVQAGGYRAALRATVHHFTAPDLEIKEELLSEMEHHGIASEWDMSPLIIAAYWDAILSRAPIPNLPSDVSAAAREIKTSAPIDLAIPKFDLVAGQYPAESAFHAGCFASIPHELRKNLLTSTRDVRKSHTMRTFQHYTLGSENFADTYQMQPEIQTESFLLTCDHSNVNDEIRAKIRQLHHHIAAFTARPSHPPREANDSTLGYAPEAELALDLISMKDIPLIAFGKLEYIAAQHGLDPATLVKPSPFQALAGTLAAWTGDEHSALQAAYNWHNTGALNGNFQSLPPSFDLMVVEDTMGGIRSVKAAGEILQKAGFDVHVHAIGLTSGNAAKASAFEKAGVIHFENWTSLIEGVSL